ncbi:MAG TPA: TylF/MycF/NovP-related O-methyltransferase [Gaiellaceae bacterium]|nr:TylF/MycF/NovP-related O-methyltransferase [Gaiellaceae bacterium]
MRRLLRRPLRRALRVFGYELKRTRSPWPRDFVQADIDLCREVAPFTMTTPEAIYVLAGAVRHVVSNGLPGAIVECGVWKGGSMMAVAKTLLSLGKTDVDLFLFDTFEGMSEPTEKDIHWSGETAKTQLAREEKEASLTWARATLDEVQQAMRSIPYPPSRIHFVKGRVEDTLPDQAPPQIALLRLDTDWYESTRHELVHLYPRVVPGGVLIVDDYGWWRGAAEATDEYFRANGPTPFLVRIDADGVRLSVKPHAAPAS